MARFRCVCGEEIRTSGDVPNPVEWHLLSDNDFDAFRGLVEAEDVYAATTLAYRCPRSGHLYVFWNGIDEDPILYAPTPLPRE